ncbi:outer membrane lipoprotein carrier protein LolA [Helicobacter sp. T3_23-1056]
MKQIVMTFVMCAFANAFSLENLQKNIQKSLHNHILQGKFTQEKELQGFSNKIKSYGVFRLENVEEKTLFWDTHSPIKSHIKITKKGIFTKDNKQDKWIPLSNNKHQEMLLSILSMDFRALGAYFDFDLREDKDIWILELKPKNAILAKIFDSITLQGFVKYPSIVEKVILLERNGDKTTNIFSAISINAVATKSQ